MRFDERSFKFSKTDHTFQLLKTKLLITLKKNDWEN